MNFIEIQTSWLRQYEIYGWSVLFYYWNFEEKNVFQREPLQLKSGDTVYPLKRVKKVVKDDFWARVLDVFDCFLQPGVESVEDGDWFMFREFYSRKELKKMVEAGHLYPDVTKYLDDNPTPTISQENNSGRQERDDIAGLRKDSLEHSHGKYELMWVLEDERIIRVLDRKVLASVGDNPHPLQIKPIINCNLMKQISEPIGIGTIEQLAGLPDRLNALSNARLDNIALLLNRVFLYSTLDRQLDVKNIRFSAGNGIGVSDIEKSIKFLEIPDTSQSSEREVRNTVEMMQFVSAVSDYISGTQSQAQLADTATGISTIVREGNARFALKLASFESGSLRKLIQAAHVYHMSYMPVEKMIHVLGPKGYEMTKINLDDILCECDFIIEPGSCVPLDQLSRRDALTNLFDRLMKLPTIIRLDKFAKELLESHDIRNAEDFLVVNPGELSAMDDVKLAQAENISLELEEEIVMAGNDGLHLGIHSSADTSAWSQASKEMMQAHILEHQNHIMSLQMQGGQLGPMQPAPGPQVAGPGLGGPPGIPGPMPQGGGGAVPLPGITGPVPGA